MSNKKMVLAFPAVLLVALMLSACTQSLSAAPQSTPTLIGTGLFVSPFPSADNPMEMIEQFAAGTATAAFAQTAAAGGTPLAPGTPSGTVLTPVIVTGTPSTPTNASGAVNTSTTSVAAGTTTVPTTAVVVTAGGPTPTQGPKPSSYTLQQGEFPYCIARRFNVNPEELININSLSDGQVYYPNLTLKIPQTGNPFPADRALRTHPGTYTVASSDETLYSVACKYGDVDPAAIAAVNGLSLSANLTAGQALSIP